MTTKAQQAEAAVRAYTEYVCCNVGRPFDAFKADMLALDAAEKLEAAAKDETPIAARSLRREAAEFWSIASEVA